VDEETCEKLFAFQDESEDEETRAILVFVGRGVYVALTPEEIVARNIKFKKTKKSKP